MGGGTNASNSLAKLEVYNPATNTWATKANVPTARTLLAAGAVNGILYAVGGAAQFGDPNFKLNQAYTP